MPPKNVRGMLMTNAQGQLMTKKVRARLAQTIHRPVMRDGIRTRSSAPIQTIGV